MSKIERAKRIVHCPNGTGLDWFADVEVSPLDWVNVGAYATRDEARAALDGLAH